MQQTRQHKHSCTSQSPDRTRSAQTDTPKRRCSTCSLRARHVSCAPKQTACWQRWLSLTRRAAIRRQLRGPASLFNGGRKLRIERLSVLLVEA